MRRPENRRLGIALRGAGLALFVVAQLQACSTPNSSASHGFLIASVNGEPSTPAQAERDLAEVREMLVANGFTRIEAGPGALAPPEHERIQYLFSLPDTTRFHGFVSRADDDTIHLLVVDNRRGEREGFGPESCRTVVALRTAIRQQFGNRLLMPAPDEQARQSAQLGICE